MSTIGSLEIEMYANVARLQQDMASAKNYVGNATAEMQRYAEVASKALGAIGLALSIGKIKEMVGGFIDAAEALHDLSIQTGASVESLSAMQAIGRMTGTSAETIGSAMNKLAKNMAVANESSKGTGQALKSLGIDFETLRRMKPDEQLLTVAKAMNEFEDGGGKSAAAMTLMGKEGAKLLPFMKDLATAGELVATVTTEQANQADAYNDSMEQSKLRIEALQRGLALGMLPTLIAVHDLTEALGESIREYLVAGPDKAAGSFDGLRLVVGTLGTVLETLVVLSSDVAFVFKGIGTEIGGLAAQAAAFLTGNFAGAAAIHRSMEADAASARSELDKFQASVLGSTDRILQSHDALKNHSISAHENTGEIARMTGAHGAATKGQLDFKAATDAAKVSVDKNAEAVRKLIESLDAKVAAQLLETDTGEKLTAGQKEALTVMEQLRLGTVKMTTAETQAVAAKLELLLASERINTTRTEEAKLQAEMAKDRADIIAALGKETVALQDQSDKQREQNLQLQLGDAAYESLLVARMLDRAAQLEQIAATSDQSDELMKQAALLRERAALTEQGVVLKEAKSAAEEWKKTTDSIGQGLTDSLYRAFESGKGFFSTLWSGIVNVFKTTTLKLLVQGVTSSVGSALGMGNAFAGTPGAAGAGSGLLSTIGSMGSIGSAVAGGIGAFGTAAGYGASALFGGTGLTALSGGAAMAGAGSLASGLGMIAGVLGPVALAAVAIAGLYKAFGQKAGGPMVGGSYTSGVNLASGATNGTGGGFYGAGLSDQHKLDASLAAPTAVLAGSIGGALKAFGSQVKDLQVMVATNADPRGTWLTDANLSSTVDGKRIDINKQKSGSRDDATFAGQMADWQAQLLLKTLQSGKLEATWQAYFSQFGADSMGAAQISAIVETAKGVQTMTAAVADAGGVFGQLSQLSVQARINLGNLAGGMDAFVTKTAGFVSNYYSQTEQAAIAAKQVQATLSAAGIDGSGLSTKAQYRSMVDSLNIGTDSGQQQLVALLNASDSFAKIADTLGTAGLTLGQLSQQAPQTAIMQLQADAATRTADGVLTLNTTTQSAADQITASIIALQGKVDTLQSALLSATAANAQRISDTLTEVQYGAGG